MTALNPGQLARQDMVRPPDILARRVVLFGAAAMLVISFAAWMAGLAREPGPAECRVTPTSLAFVSHVNATIRMRGDVTCTIPIADGRVGELQIKIPPGHGAITWDRDRVSYRPAPQFKGRDFFVVALRDRAARFDGTTIARVHVFVK